MNYFFIKLIPPRPTFPFDMTDGERAMMQEHFVYWKKIFGDRKAIVYGPVMDPKGSFGIAVVEAENETEARNIAENDPAIFSSFRFSIEIHPMPNAVIRQ